PCRNGKLASMVLVPVSDGDQARFKKLVQETVLKGWLKRAGADVAKEWNATVGRALGMEAKQERGAFAAHSRPGGKPETSLRALGPRFPPSLKLRRTRTEPVEALAKTGYERGALPLEPAHNLHMRGMAGLVD